MTTRSSATPATTRLLGGGGDDLIAGLGGNDVIEGGVTRTVYLDFDTDTTPGDHIYTPTSRPRFRRS